MKQRFGPVDALFGLAERSIALIDRCRPLNTASEGALLKDAWLRGHPKKPSWVYRARPDLGQLRSELASLAKVLSEGDPVRRLYAERALELELEASLAENVGTPHFSELSKRRFWDDGRHAVAASTARAWARLRLAHKQSRRFQSDDLGHGSSLVSQMLATLARMKLPISVVVKDDLQSSAAVADATVLIRPGVWLTRLEARRIVVHELLGHALPRLNARSASLGLLRVGSAGAQDDEEGRALLLEQRFGLLCGQRQAELGLRHLAAASVFDGADWIETVRQLLGHGAELEPALSIACRVHRGGGLAREVVYLPAMQRVSEALSLTPELDDWLAGGRLSVNAARVLCVESPEAWGPCYPAAELAREFHE